MSRRPPALCPAWHHLPPPGRAPGVSAQLGVGGSRHQVNEEDVEPGAFRQDRLQDSAGAGGHFPWGPEHQQQHA